METQTLQRAETAADTGALWTLDPVQGTIGFAINHMAFDTVRGRFGRFWGTIRFDGGSPHDAFVEAEIDAASIDTGNTFRDEHLRSADFFDVAAYPTIAFRSTRVEPVNPLNRDRWVVVGDLTMGGVTRSVELAVEQTGGTNPWEAEIISFAATATISRKDFGIGDGLVLSRGDLVIGDEVKIAIDVRALKGSTGGR